MFSFDHQRIPISDSKGLQRHHTMHYYVHRARESLTTRVSKIICATVLALVFIFGIIAFILWLSLRPHRPRIHVEDFSIPGLAQPTGFENAQIIVNVTARNSNQHVGFYYDGVVGQVYYKDQQIGSTPLSGSFYQEPKTTTDMYKVLSGATLTVNSQRWSEFFNERAQGNIPFRLDLSSNIKFKISTWTSKSHPMHSSCDVFVGPDGSILATSRGHRCPVYFL